MRYLFEIEEQLKKAILDSDKILLLLDYDGTLTPIVSRPENARLPEETRSILEKLSAMAEIEIAIVSGRSISQLENFIPIDGLTLIGNHGLEFKIPSGSIKQYYSDHELDIINSAKTFLESRIKEIDGVTVEDKGPIIALHYRNVSEKDMWKIENIIEDAKSEFPKELDFSSGKMVFEVKPQVKRDKGLAAHELLDSQENRSELTMFYLGDDLTDEDAFKTLEGKAYTIFVGGDSKSSAGYFLLSTGDVLKFLRFISDTISGGE